MKGCQVILLICVLPFTWVQVVRNLSFLLVEIISAIWKHLKITFFFFCLEFNLSSLSVLVLMWISLSLASKTVTVGMYHMPGQGKESTPEKSKHDVVSRSGAQWQSSHRVGESLQALQHVDAIPHPFDISRQLVSKIVDCVEKNHKRMKSLLVTTLSLAGSSE